MMQSKYISAVAYWTINPICCTKNRKWLQIFALVKQKRRHLIWSQILHQQPADPKFKGFKPLLHRHVVNRFFPSQICLHLEIFCGSSLFSGSTSGVALARPSQVLGARGFLIGSRVPSLTGAWIYVNNKSSTTIFNWRYCSSFEVASCKSVTPWPNLAIRTFSSIVVEECTQGQLYRATHNE